MGRVAADPEGRSVEDWRSRTWLLRVGCREFRVGNGNIERKRYKGVTVSKVEIAVAVAVAVSG
jgi:hypothetical protein